MVTSKNVGLAVPDWPTTFGYNMFLFPISKWVGGILFEHTHRLMGSLVGVLTIILAVWLWLREERQWVRSLGVIAVVGVILQGILGGLRVTMMKDQIGIFHACVAQAFLGLLVFIALVTTRFWRSLANRHFDPQKFLPIKSLAIAITVAIYVQLALGATMRHQHRDLAILDFPTANGAWIPNTSAAALAKINAWRDARALSDVNAFQIWLQMVHRFLALIIALAIVVFCARVWRETHDLAPLKRLSILWVVLIFCQISLGAWVIWSNKAADVATAHVALGAVMLSFGVSNSAICWRISGRDSVLRADAAARRRCHREPIPHENSRAVETPSIAASRHSFASDLAELVKARLTLLVLLTTAVGFYLGAEAPINYKALLQTVFGTAAAAAGAAALNQWWERRADALMQRTKARPIPAGRMSPLQALLLGAALSVFGVAYLAFVVNALSAVLTAITIAIYIFAYTPLKRTSTANTAVGAIPGAIPPMIGWAAARGQIDAGAWSLFVIVFLWQMPHFFAIAWMCREDYSRAGFRMISSDDSSGERSASQGVFFCILLLVLAGLPAFVGIASYAYQPIELVLGGLFVAVAMRFLRLRTRSAARLLFFASIAYLPLLLTALVLTKL